MRERERAEEGRGGIVEQRNECNVEGTVNSGSGNDDDDDSDSSGKK